MAVCQILKGLSVLVVEDEYFIAMDLQRLLHDNSARSVRLSGSVDDAIRQVSAGGFELVLIDIKMHANDTLPVADMLLKRNIPFAFVTGYDRGALPERFADIPLWSKPFDSRQLAIKIAALWRDGARTAR